MHLSEEQDRFFAWLRMYKTRPSTVINFIKRNITLKEQNHGFCIAVFINKIYVGTYWKAYSLQPTSVSIINSNVYMGQTYYSDKLSHLQQCPEVLLL